MIIMQHETSWAMNMTVMSFTFYVQQSGSLARARRRRLGASRAAGVMTRPVRALITDCQAGGSKQFTRCRQYVLNTAA